MAVPTAKPHPHHGDLTQEEDVGLSKGLSRRQIQMIALGSAIGAGLFLGAGSRLEIAGPSLALLYLICGFFAYLILRSLGELIVYRPTSGSFVSYTREFFGEKAAYTAGWLYWFNWATTAIADATAIAIYARWFSQYWPALGEIPQWAWAFGVLIVVLLANLVSVKLFGELEFWFSLVKVGAITVFLLVGIVVLLFGHPNGDPVGFQLITSQGGFFPHGILPAVVVIQGVVFAYAGIELLGTTAGEMEEPQVVVPKAIKTVIFRISVFYFGSILLLTLVLPATSYSATESPFVTFFDSLGVDAAAPLMQLIVITAALSSLNAGLYSTGRIMRSLALAGSAPAFGEKLSRNGVPYGGIIMTTAVAFSGVILNFFIPAQAFEVVLNIAALGTIASWVAISGCHIRFVQWAKKGMRTRPSFKAPLSPFVDWLTLAFLALVVVLMAFDYPIGSWTLVASLVFWIFLLIGWKLMGKTDHPPVYRDPTRPINTSNERNTAS